METQHTKGEWKLSPFHNGIHIYSIGKKICSVWYALFTDKEALANAKLIAAAPELLEALVLALSRVDAEYERTESNYVKQILDRGNEAIQKATK